MKTTSEIKFVPKGWGYERWLVNNDLYCGKILWFAKGKRCSWHYHLVKTETFFCKSGRLQVAFGLTDAWLDSEIVILEPGDTFHVPPGMRHQMVALEDTEMFEFSTHHEDSDSYVVVKGDVIP